jgi:hypothetical protein
MDLQAASTWLERSHVGFSEIHKFAESCRLASLEQGHESAALVLLAERAANFAERYEGVAVCGQQVAEFLVEMRREAIAMRDARTESDAKFVEALNLVAARLANNLYV